MQKTLKTDTTRRQQRLDSGLSWNSVNNILKQDKNLKPATKDEFLEKVKSYPEEDFIGNVKDVANAGEKSATSWGGLFSDCTLPAVLSVSFPI
jgi:hypothetical protein